MTGTGETVPRGTEDDELNGADAQRPAVAAAEA